MTTSSNALSFLSPGWTWAKLGEIAEVIRGASPRPKGDPRYFGGTIPWIMISDISKEEGKFISKTRDTVTEEGAKKSRLLKAGTLILSNSGTVCVPKILAVDGCIHDGFVAFPELTKNLEMLYLYYYFDYIRPKIIQENRQGVTQVNLNTNIVKNIDVPLPPLAEQHRIASKIEELFSVFDAGVESLRKVKAQLKRYRQAVLKYAFEGKLTQEWRKTHGKQMEPAQKLLEQIKQERRHSWEENLRTLGRPPEKHRYKEAVSVDVDAETLPRLPSEWIYASADELSVQITDGEHVTPRRQKEGIYLLSARNVLDGRLTLDDVDFISNDEYERIERRLNPEPGDVLLSCSGSVGRTCVVPEGIKFSMVRSVALLKPMRKFVSGKYLSLALRSDILRSQINRKKTQTAQANIFQGKIRTLIFPLAPFQEQHQIVEEVERCFSMADEVEKMIGQVSETAERLRHSILKTAFRGKLVPQDPADESAERLLERIKEERARQMTKEDTNKVKKE